MQSLVGEAIENYQIIELVGSGGMGVVYKAIDTNLGKTVALKMIKPEHEKDGLFIKNFKREAQSIARIDNHPNIVTVHNFIQSEKGTFIIMEFVEGKTLSDLIEERIKFLPNAAWPVLKQILQAIGYAHQHQVIHRDLKPKNIILKKDGKVKITDFGLAKQVAKEHETTTVAGRGTLYYMSPEQVRGGKDVTHLTDIYAIGMTLYEMLTGKRPFDQTDSQYTTEQRIVEGKLPPPSVFIPDLDPKLEKIILKAIHHRPDRRYQSAEEMLAELGRYFADTDVPYPIPPNGGKKKMDGNRLVNMKYIIPAFTILLVLVIVVLILQNGKHNISEGNNKKSGVREDNSPRKTVIVQPPVQRPTHGMEEISQALVANKLRSGDKLVRIAFVNNNEQLQKVLKKIDFRQTWILWSALKSDPVRRYLYLPTDSLNTPERLIGQFALRELIPGQTRLPVETVHSINNHIVFILEGFINL